MVVLNIYLYFNLNDYVDYRISTPGIIDHRWTQIAEYWYKDGVYSDGTKDAKGNLNPTFSATPVYPFMFYISYLIFGVTEGSYENKYDEGLAYEVMRIIALLMNMGTVYLSYQIGKLFGNKLAIIIFLLAILNMDSYLWASRFGTPDTALAFFATLSVFYLIKFLIINQSNKNIGLFSLFLGISILTKITISYIWVPLLIFLIVYLWRSNNLNSIEKGRFLCIYIIIIGVFWGGWKIRNYYSCGSLKFSSHEGLLYHASYFVSRNEGIDFKEVKKGTKDKLNNSYRYRSMNEASKSAVQDSVAMEMILNSPMDYGAMVLKGIFPFLLSTKKPLYLSYSEKKQNEIMSYYKDYRNSLDHERKLIPITFGIISVLRENGYMNFVVTNILIKTYNCFLIIFFILGLFLFLLNEKLKGHWIIICVLIFIGYFWAVCGIIPQARYRAPIMPIIYLFSAYGITNLKQFYFNFRIKR